MKETADKVQMVINTLQDLDIKSSFHNLNRIFGMLQALNEIKDDINCPELKEVKENAGNADTQ